MKTTARMLLLSTALCALTLNATPAAAATETITTVTTPGPLPAGSHNINLNDFDNNKDGLISTYEAGEMLFNIFDTGDDGIIDSTEYGHRSLMTVVPMQKKTTVIYDFNNDGRADKTQSTFESFTQNSQLSRFSSNPAGLSPNEFIEMPFTAVDTNSNNSIDKAEWRTAYISKIGPISIN